MQMIENFVKMMSGSLMLEEPWYVSHAKFNEEEMALHIYVDVRDDAQIACPACGSVTRRYGYEPDERVWRHGDCMFYPCYVHGRRPKVQCPKCGVLQVNAPFERKNSRFTLLFEGYAMLIMADMPISKAAAALRCDEKSLSKILHHWVKKAVDETDLSGITTLAIDETSFKRGHKYVTLVIDAAERRVIDIEEGRESKTISLFAEKLIEKGGDPEKITAVTSDMSKSYLPAISANFPNAESIIDKFHVKKELIDALDHVRIDEQKEVATKKELFGIRRLFMVPRTKLSDEQEGQIAIMSKRYPKVGRAYRIVAALDDLYSCQNIHSATEAFYALCSWMRRCRLPPMKKAAKTLMNHKDRILNYFKNRITNAICEGINSMIQAAKRKARGYHTFEGYAAMIYLITGKLKLAVPKPF